MNDAESIAAAVLRLVSCRIVRCEQVARRASTACGMPAPTLVHFEQQIDDELSRQQNERAPAAAAAAATTRRDSCRGVADGQEDGMQSAELTAAAKLQRRRPAAIEVDWMSLDEMVNTAGMTAHENN